METPESDYDYLVIYFDNPKEILINRGHKDSKFVENITVGDDKLDVHFHEIGKVIDKLIEGNINFIVAIESPEIYVFYDEFYELRNLVERNLNKSIAKSLVGMIEHNWKKYILSGRDLSQKRARRIYRYIKLGENIFKYNQVKFEKIDYEIIESDIEEGINYLKELVNTSNLPENLDENAFLYFLLKFRAYSIFAW